MPGTTIKEFASKLAESTNATFKKNNPDIFGASGGEGDRPGHARADRPPETAGAKSASDRARIKDKPVGTTPEERLNKLERRWLAVLRANYPNPIGIQNITLRLSDRTRYRPDLNVFWNGKLRLWETKGPHRFREKGILKLKWAAKEYPFFDFYLVTWDKDSQKWTETRIAKE